MGRQRRQRRDHIITKSSRETQGGLAGFRLGTVDRGARARYGGKLGDHGTYRVYGLGFERGNTVTSDGTDAMDDWAGRQAGFRTDWSAAANALTLQGDLFDNPTEGGSISGGNLLARWEIGRAHV